MPEFKVGDKVRFRMPEHYINGKTGVILEPTVRPFAWRVTKDEVPYHDWIAVTEDEIELITEPEEEE